MNLRNLLLALLAVIALAFAACGGGGDGAPATTPTAPAAQDTPAATAAAFPVTITDDQGNTLTLDAAPRRIVALQPSFVEVLYAIGAGDTIVAADENTDYPPEAADIPRISGFQPSVEGIASYQPDLVLLSYDPGGLVDALRQLDISLLFLDSPSTIDGTYAQIETIGKASGHAAEAAGLVAAMKADIADIIAKLPAGAQGPRIFHEVDNTYYTAGPGSFIDDLYAALGARNIAASTGEPYPQMSSEAIIQADPEVIILADEFAGESPQTVAARPGWDQTSAVKNGRVHLVDPNIISRPGPRIVDALETLAKLLYPEKF